MTDLIVRVLLALLAWLDPGCLRCACRAASPVPPPPAPRRAPTPDWGPLPRHRSPYAAESAAEAEADRVGGPRRWPPPGPRPYAPAVWHHPDRPSRKTGAASRLTQGRRRAELWLATVGVDAGPRRIHGVTVGAAPAYRTLTP